MKNSKILKVVSFIKKIAKSCDKKLKTNPWPIKISSNLLSKPNGEFINPESETKPE